MKLCGSDAREDVTSASAAQNRSCEMNLFVRSLCFLCVLCAPAVNAFSLDREAFTFTNYDLNVRIEPEQQRLGVRGKITLRNDSATPQKIAVLQISSSLDWRSIDAGDKAVQFVTQPYTSDIDHTGALSEAIVTLPQAVPPEGNRRTGDRVRRRHPARCHAAHPHRHARGRGQEF